MRFPLILLIGLLSLGSAFGDGAISWVRYKPFSSTDFLPVNDYIRGGFPPFNARKNQGTYGEGSSGSFIVVKFKRNAAKLANKHLIFSFKRVGELDVDSVQYQVCSGEQYVILRLNAEDILAWEAILLDENGDVLGQERSFLWPK